VLDIPSMRRFVSAPQKHRTAHSALPGAPSSLCHRFAMTSGNTLVCGEVPRVGAEHPNRSTSLAKSRKAAPRLRFL